MIRSIRSIRSAAPLLAASALLLPAGAAAQVDFSAVSISEVLTLAEIQAAVGASSTDSLDGVSLGPAGQIGVIHLDDLAQPTLALIDPATKAATFSTGPAAIAADLGAPYTANFTLVGEFVFAPMAGASGVLYWADNSTATFPGFAYSLLATDIATGTTTEVLRSTEIAGWNSHGVLPSGVIVGALGEDREDLVGEEPAVGLVDPSDATPGFALVYDMDEFIDAFPGALPPGAELPPETVAVDPNTGVAYFFCHDEFELFRVVDIEADAALAPASRPGPEWLDIPGWSGIVDFHAMSVDGLGNLWGFDEAAETITVWSPTTGNVEATIGIDDISAALGGGPMLPVLWRGMKARSLSATEVEVLLADSTGAYGVVRLVFGTPAASVADWAVID